MTKLYIKIFALMIALLIGCSSQKDIIRDKTVQIAVPPIKVISTNVRTVNTDSLLLIAIDSLATDSTYFESEEVTTKGDTLKVKFYPKTKAFTSSSVLDNEHSKPGPKFEIEVKQKPIEYRYQDTTHVVKERKTLSDYLIYLIVLAVIASIIIYLVKSKR